jgi:hypothetical protein
MFSIPSTCHGVGLHVWKVGLERQDYPGRNTPVEKPQRECHDGNAPALVWMLGEGYCILLHERSVYACELHEYRVRLWVWVRMWVARVRVQVWVYIYIRRAFFCILSVLSLSRGACSFSVHLFLLFSVFARLAFARPSPVFARPPRLRHLLI